MKTYFLGFDKKQDQDISIGNGRRKKNYFDKFFEQVIRKTDSDKRLSIFGYDPLK